MKSINASYNFWVFDFFSGSLFLRKTGEKKTLRRDGHNKRTLFTREDQRAISFFSDKAEGNGLSSRKKDYGVNPDKDGQKKMEFPADKALKKGRFPENRAARADRHPFMDTSSSVDGSKKRGDLHQGGDKSLEERNLRERCSRLDRAAHADRCPVNPTMPGRHFENPTFPGFLGLSQIKPLRNSGQFFLLLSYIAHFLYLPQKTEIPTFLPWNLCHTIREMIPFLAKFFCLWSRHRKDAALLELYHLSAIAGFMIRPYFQEILGSSRSLCPKTPAFSGCNFFPLGRNTLLCLKFFSNHHVSMDKKNILYIACEKWFGMFSLSLFSSFSQPLTRPLKVFNPQALGLYLTQKHPLSPHI